MEDTSFWDATDKLMNAAPPAQPATAPDAQQPASFWEATDRAMGTASPKSMQRQQELAPKFAQADQWAAEKNQNAPVNVMGVPGWNINLGKEVGSETLSGVGWSVKDVLRRTVPGTEFQSAAEEKRYGEAVKARDKYLSGESDEKPTDAQLGRIAEYEYDQRREAARSQRSKIATAALSIPKVVGEFAVAGPAMRAIGGAAGVAAGTPLMPEFWLEKSQQNANRNGGEWYSPQNVAAPLAQAAVQNVVLGQIAKYAGAAAESAPTALGKLGVKAAVGAAAMPLESAAAETLTSTVQAALTDTKFGKYLDPEEEQFKTFRDILAGKWGDIGTKLATDALMGAGFAAFHGNNAKPVESLQAATEKLRKAGLSQEGAVKALQDAISRPEGELPPGPLKDAQEAFKKAGETPKSEKVAELPPEDALNAESWHLFPDRPEVPRAGERPAEASRSVEKFDQDIEEAVRAGFGDRTTVDGSMTAEKKVGRVSSLTDNYSTSFEQAGPNRVKIDFERVGDQGPTGFSSTGEKVPPGSIEQIKGLGKALKAMAEKGYEVSYEAVKDKAENDFRDRLYEKALPKAGYEKVGQEGRETVWKPKEKAKEPNIEEARSPELQRLYDHPARSKGFTASPEAATKSFLNQLYALVRKKLPEETRTVDQAIAAFHKGDLGTATAKAELALSAMHFEEAQTGPRPPVAETAPNYATPAGPGSGGTTATSIKSALASPVGAGKVGEDILRANLAQMVRQKEIASKELEKVTDTYDAKIIAAKTPQAKTDIFLELTDAIEGGKIASLPPDIRPVAESIRRLTDERSAALKSRGMMEKFIDNYLGHIWKKAGANPDEVQASLNARRPLAGSEAFKKRRTIPTYRDGIAAGLEPADPNPIRLALLKLHEMDKAIMAHDVVGELTDNAMWPFVRLGKSGPEGYDRVNDKISTVFAPGEAKVREYFDKQQMEALEKFADSLKIRRERVTSGLGKAAGVQLPNEIKTKFGTPEEVLAHEIGHELDRRYGLSGMLNDPTAAKELTDLADLRASGRVSAAHQTYLRSDPERIANLVAAYVHAPELLQKIAPTAKSFLDAAINSHPELHPLRDIKPSLELGQRDQMMRLAGPILTGHYYAPAEVATLLNNHVTPGLHGKYKTFDIARVLSNSLNQFQLGFTAFHAGFVTMDTQVSAAAHAIQRASQGKFNLRTLAEGLRGVIPLASPIRAWTEGSKVLREYYKPGSQGAETAAIVDALVNAGGRAKMDAFYGGTHIEAFRKALREVRSGEWKKTPNLLGNALPAVAELVSKPVMEHLVPRMKLGVFAELARTEMEKHPNMTPAEYRRALGKAWDSVENRLGQLTYDNLFWNRTVKDALMVGVRSVGWNVGTVRELGGGVKDVPKSVRGVLKGEGVSPRLAYLVALPMVTAIYGAMYQYLATGKGPDEAQDYFFPKTGRTRKDGSPDRSSLPSYMRDIGALSNRAGEGPVRIASNLWTMAKHKLNPGVSTVAEMLNNEDFYGKAIYLPQDSTGRKIWELAKHIIAAAQPFSFRKPQSGEVPDAATRIQSFFGITPAPAYITRPDAQQQAIEAKQSRIISPTEKLKMDRAKQK